MSGIRLPDCSKLAKNKENDNDVTICWHDVSSNFFDVVLLLLSGLITGPSFMSILWLVLESRSFSFIRDQKSPEIRKLEISLYTFCAIFGDWDKLEIPNLARMSLMKCYWVLQNTKATAFTVFELLRENQQGIKLPLPTQTRVKRNWRSTNWKIIWKFSSNKNLAPTSVSISFLKENLSVLSAPISFMIDLSYK